MSLAGLARADAAPGVTRALSLVGAIEAIPVPTVALIHGRCFARVLEVALACNVIWAAERTQIGQLEDVIGAFPFAGGVGRLASRIGAARPAEMVFGAHVYSAEDLATWGLVGRVLPAEWLVAEGRAFAAQLAKGPTLAHRAAKRILQTWRSEGVAEADELTRTEGPAVILSQDLQRGVEALKRSGRAMPPSVAAEDHDERMSSNVITGYDGKPRCAWAGAGDSGFGRYHDEVWGTRTYDESAMFEALTLGVFEVGLSWSIVFGKRDAFRTAFRGFDVAKVAAMTERDVDRLTEDASIIRNRGKIQATVDNARAMMSASPSLAALAKSYEITRKRAPRSVADLPKTTPQAEAFARQLKSQGYRFIGPTSVYAFMQNVGVVNDHVHGCFRAVDYRTRAARR